MPGGGIEPLAVPLAIVPASFSLVLTDRCICRAAGHLIRSGASSYFQAGALNVADSKAVR